MCYWIVDLDVVIFMIDKYVFVIWESNSIKNNKYINQDFQRYFFFLSSFSRYINKVLICFSGMLNLMQSVCFYY